MHKWLSIIGIGEDGIAGLSKTANLLVNQAEILVGGERHLAMLPPDDGRKKISWNSPFGNYYTTKVNKIFQSTKFNLLKLQSGQDLNLYIPVP